MASGIVFHTFAALVYLGLSTLLWGTLQAGKPMDLLGRFTRWGVLMALLFQGIALNDKILAGGNLQLSWVLALSAAIWLGLIVFWLESLVVKIDGLQLILLPIAGVTCAIAAIFPDTHLITSATETALRGHLLLALGAYGLITIAAMQSLLMAALDHHLHHPREAAHRASGLRRAFGRMLDAQPPLLVQERLLFRIIWIAFGALSLAVISGGLISLASTGRWLPFDHKTIFTILSWVTFGILLLGRQLRGWRGRIALRYTLVGFVFVVLSYTGSRFVIEVILSRT
uniref:cytochrome C assembly family protein n=1 Tax=Orrella sp. TaxID=1921583 RepID=UPI004047CF9D